MKHALIGLIIALGMLAGAMLVAHAVVTVSTGSNPEVQL